MIPSLFGTTSQKSSFADAFADNGRSALVVGSTTVVCLIFASWVWKRVSSSSSGRTKNGFPYVAGNVLAGGCVDQIFQSPVPFILENQAKHGNKFYVRVANLEWLFLLDNADLQQVMRLSWKDASMFGPINDLVGFLFPKDTRLSTYPKPLREKLDNTIHSSVPHIAFSVRPPAMKAWVPMVRKVIQQALEEVLEPDEGSSDKGSTLIQGRFDLFEYARLAISGVTTMLMIGADAASDPKFLREWIDLFTEADIENGFSNPYQAISTIIEATVLGERRIFRRIRALLKPMVDKEVEECLTGVPLSTSTTNPPSALASFVRFVYERDMNRNAEHLHLAKTRIANEMITFSFAAFSNSYTGAAWGLYHVLKDTSGIGTQIRRELDLTLSMNGEVDDDPARLVPSCLQHLIYEITRLYTPGHIQRKLMRDDLILKSTGERIPKGTIIAMNHFVSARSPLNKAGDENKEKDDDAKDDTPPLTSFDPSRFASSKNGTSRNSVWMGFGTGTHPCVGKHLALLEIGIFIQEVVRHFDTLKVVPNKDEVRNAELMDKVMDNVPDHPNLDPTQSAFLWRPVNKIYIEYSTKNQTQ